MKFDYRKPLRKALLACAYALVVVIIAEFTDLTPLWGAPIVAALEALRNILKDHDV